MGLLVSNGELNRIPFTIYEIEHLRMQIFTLNHFP